MLTGAWQERDVALSDWLKVEALDGDRAPVETPVYVTVYARGACEATFYYQIAAPDRSAPDAPRAFPGTTTGTLGARSLAVNLDLPGGFVRFGARLYGPDTESFCADLRYHSDRIVALAADAAVPATPRTTGRDELMHEGAEVETQASRPLGRDGEPPESR